MGRGLSPPPLAAVRLPLPPLPGPSLAARLARRGLPGAPAPGTPGLPVEVRARPNRCGGPALRRGFFNPRGGPSSFAPAAPAWPCGPPLSLRSRGSAPPAGLCPGVGGPAPGGFWASLVSPGGGRGCPPGGLAALGRSPRSALVPAPPPPPRRGPGWCSAGLGAWRCWAWRPCLVGGPLNPAFAGPILDRGGGWRYSAPHPLAPPARAAGPPWLASLGACRDPRPPAAPRPPSPSGGTRGSAGLAGVPTFFPGSD